MDGASLQPRVDEDRTNGARVDHPRDKGKKDGASLRRLTHSRVAGANLHRTIGARRRLRVRASKRDGGSKARMTGGNLLLHPRAIRGNGASPRNQRAPHSQAQVAQ